MKYFYLKIGLLFALSLGLIFSENVVSPLISSKNIVTTSSKFSPLETMSSVYAVYLDNKPESGVSGTAFAIRYKSENLVVTNQHVVSLKKEYYYLKSKNQKVYKAKLIYSSKDDDLAFLRIIKNPNIDTLDLSYKIDNTFIGSTVFTIGNPYDFLFSFSDGVISNIDRNVLFEDGDFDDILIQTNINVNPGNSGGPLLNSKGEVIGIISSMLEDSEGISFAIPSKTILKHLRNL